MATSTSCRRCAQRDVHRVPARAAGHTQQIDARRTRSRSKLGKPGGYTRLIDAYNGDCRRHDSYLFDIQALNDICGDLRAGDDCHPRHRRADAGRRSQASPRPGDPTTRSSTSIFSAMAASTGDHPAQGRRAAVRDRRRARHRSEGGVGGHCALSPRPGREAQAHNRTIISTRTTSRDHDGRRAPRRALESVRSTAVSSSRRSRSRSREILEYIDYLLVTRSPVKTGAYQRNHRLFADGVETDPRKPEPRCQGTGSSSTTGPTRARSRLVDRPRKARRRTRASTRARWHWP